MTPKRTFTDYTSRLVAFISAGSKGTSGQPSASADSFNSLALDLFALQFEHVLPFRRLCESRQAIPGAIQHWSEIPAMPTSLFKEVELSSLAAEERTSVFYSSGTTEQRPSRHYHSAASLAAYEASLVPWFAKNVLGDWDELQETEVVGPLDKPGFIFLTPSPALAPHSSLVHMFATVGRELGTRDSFFGGRIDSSGGWTLDMDQVLFGLRKSMCANRPVAIMGTAFSFVHLLDHFAGNNIRYRLAEGSRVLETGGYKGRSREMPKQELHQLISRHLGVPRSRIFCEYGMSELSSQAYDTLTAPDAASRVFHFPPWARAQVVSPETGKEVNDEDTGLLRIFDLANVRSVLAIQTEDLAVKRANGFELVGRAKIAEPRGCSLMPA